jgi:PadR family transcriptional regulator PadR
MMARDEWSRELKKGTVQLGVLALLSEGEKYGFQLIKELKDLSDGYLVLKEGTLYPALHRMEKRGLIASEWSVEDDKPRRYYVITPTGEAELKKGIREWRTMVSSVNSVLEVTK